MPEKSRIGLRKRNRSKWGK